ncbi:MAG: hypothetical protein Tsb0014_01100 [Pleurocapsa sp.]
MSNAAICPCCSNKLLHHVGHHRDYWFCRSCWQEMPVLEIKQEEETKTVTPIVNLSVVLNSLNSHRTVLA